MSQVPDVPGTRVPPRSDQESWLKEHVARLCEVDHNRSVRNPSLSSVRRSMSTLERFPGSQPVSFAQGDLAKLESQECVILAVSVLIQAKTFPSFWVCEKSDGMRVLLLVHTDTNAGSQTVYLIDRKNSYYELQGFFFPHHENPQMPLQNTIVDGELVYDVDPGTKHQTLRFLAFDCLVVNNQNIMSRPLDKRYGRLKEWFHKPFAKMKKDHSHVTQTHPFDIGIKDLRFSYHAEQVFAELPTLQHGNDGLIYTCVNTPYKPGTDDNILKWKPPSENSIDFKLVLRFPPLPQNPSQPDFHAKPVFLLHVWCGDERGTSKYEQYDQMYVDDDEWEKMKSSGEQYDDRIVEVHWEPSHSRWRIMRFRDDKPNGNHRKVVENIIQSIADGVEKDTVRPPTIPTFDLIKISLQLLERSNSIRTAWKARMAHPPPSANPAASAPLRPPPGVVSLRAPPLELRYGRLATSQWSRVSGPPTVAGMNR
ncbi:mRNA capping enzyme, catalytic domain-containing protein [Mycena rosella]|uniref:mRNA guanylyltransferase n=1 Tax=Mycena rosella TaxID=1033263 RepID=A0AAD7MBQ8_MYCRO|nr:mRNA capping enzyme, catalytic domain-containing protein [Mycena rosella]